jgi:predicted RecB family nuclease
VKASRDGSGLSLSATDLSGFNECEHKIVLELAVATGQLERPGENELERRMLEKRGFEHEARVFEHLAETRKDIAEIGMGPNDASRAEAVAATRQAMERGAELIAQGVLVNERWFGRPDFLLKVDRPSRFGAYSYVVADAKLANEAKARAVLQLCAYSELLAEQQGSEPERLYIAPGGSEVRLIALRTADYLSYYRLAKRRLEAFVADGEARAGYPEPVEHCRVCSWWKRCEERRRADDHLSLVAGISARQRDRLNRAQVARVTELGALDPTLRVDGIAKASLTRVREQARLQVAGRAVGKPLYELLLDVEPTFGLDRLPAPTAGDLFLDLEGDPFVQDNGLEYLFGLLEVGEGAARYHGYWSKTHAEEKRAFEAVVDRIFERRQRFPDLHVFHFGHREADALKSLSCRHRTRENQVDQLLREHVLVDLHGIVKRSLRASVEITPSSSSKRCTTSSAARTFAPQRVPCSSLVGCSKPAKVSTRRANSVPRSSATTGTTASRLMACAIGWRRGAANSSRKPGQFWIARKNPSRPPSMNRRMKAPNSRTDCSRAYQKIPRSIARSKPPNG